MNVDVFEKVFSMVEMVKTLGIVKNGNDIKPTKIVKKHLAASSQKIFDKKEVSHDWRTNIVVFESIVIYLTSWVQQIPSSFINNFFHNSVLFSFNKEYYINQKNAQKKQKINYIQALFALLVHLRAARAVVKGLRSIM